MPKSEAEVLRRVSELKSLKEGDLLRDLFAILAPQDVLSGILTYKGNAEARYKFADAMLEARRKK